MDLKGFLTFLLSFIAVVKAQRVAPGVPPQQYQQQQMHQVPQHMPQQQIPQQQIPQQQMHMQQQQQQQMHMQQVPQMQQVPIQQQQQQLHQVPQQQMPQQQMPQQVQQQVPIQQQQPGAHHGHHGQGQILNAANIAHEKQHIQEHLEVPSMDTSKMTEQELQFHYFKMHDADNNNKLDGCELIKSLIHWHEQGHKDPSAQHGQQPPQDKIFKDDELVALIDPILNMDDANGDGFIDYPEFVRAQNKAAATANAGART